MVSVKNVSVCHIISGDLWAGAEVQVFNLLQTLVKNPVINISVICFNDGILSRRLADIGMSVTVVDEKKKGVLRSVQNVSKILHLIRCDIVHVHGYKEMFIVILAKIFGFNSIKIVRTFHGLGMLNSSKKYRALEKFCSLFLFHAICVSNDLMRIIINKKLLPSEKVTVFHNCICMNNTVSDSVFKQQLRLSLKIPNDSLIIGTVGRLVKVKGHRILIEAVGKLIQKNPKVYLVIVGDGPLLNDLNEMVNELNLSKNILLTGFKENAADIITVFDIFVLSSFHEGIPMVLLEAIRSNIPIVTTDVGGISEILQNGISASFCKPGNVDELVYNCESLVNDKELRVTLSNNAFEKVKNELNVDVLAQKMETFYCGMVKK